VRSGDTLFSIANEYYNEPDKIKEIVLWNQAWVRFPEEILAGLALILFPEESTYKNPKVVENYIQRLRISGNDLP
jgi:hypothetical protein